MLWPSRNRHEEGLPNYAGCFLAGVLDAVNGRVGGKVDAP